ncbi:MULTISPECIES: type IV pilus biogenesis protein PilM [Paraburkholderia]|uniref:type IV pilus biogenesis protein PilM n=1 Tax=Paraburkholderia TaxID=1822464 RepID=UPI000381D23E|nr:MULTISPECIES: type IV pilus biogenesis protein PilM [Paraburkholderia]MDH6146218.1 hypothetical protein [Paraburkholderia sp. WSM4179]
MYLIWTVVAFSTLIGAYALFDGESVSTTAAPSDMALALNLSDYRQAVMAYVQAHPGVAGSVPGNVLQLSSGEVPNNAWHNYVATNPGQGAGSEVIVYAASTRMAAVVPGIEQLAQGSMLAGAADNGYVVSSGNPAVALPASVTAGVPNGAPVWIGQVYP